MSPSESRPPTTTDAGIPVASEEHSLTVGPDGPILLQDFYLIEQMANFNRERIPERQPHAKGGGAFGTFEVAKDVSAFTKAAVFQPGARPKSWSGSPRWPASAGRPTRGATRAVSREVLHQPGQLRHRRQQHAGLLHPRPDEVPDFIRSQKRRADNNLRDHDMQWDFWTLSPESAHQVTWLMGTAAFPQSWRHMNGYSATPTCGSTPRASRFWVQVSLQDRPGHRIPHPGGGRPAGRRGRRLPQRDLFEAIERGRLPELDAENADHAVRGRQDLPVQPVRPDQGLAAPRLSADRGRPADAQPQPHRQPHRDRAGGVRAQQPRARYRRQPGQDAAWPGCSPTPMRTGPGSASTTSRSRSTPASHRCTATPRTAPCGWTTWPIRSTAPNSKGGAGRRRPTAYAEQAVWAADGDMVRAAYSLHAGGRRLGQAGTLVREVMDDAARDRLVATVSGLSAGLRRDEVRQRAFEYWRNIDKVLGDRIEAAALEKRR